jgi:hypothetical protein
MPDDAQEAPQRFRSPMALAMSLRPPAGRHKPARPSSGAFGNRRDGGAAATRAQSAGVQVSDVIGSTRPRPQRA